MRDALPRLEGAFDRTDEKQIDRRHLLKMGAWAAPIVVLATAAPAAAASTPVPRTISWDYSTATLAHQMQWGSAVGLTTTVGVQNTTTTTGGAANTGDISGTTLNAVYARSAFSGEPVNPTGITGAGWSFVAKSVGTDTVTYTFRYAPTLSPGVSSPVLTYDIHTAPSYAVNPVASVTFVTSATVGPSMISRSARTAVADGFWFFNTGTTGGMSAQPTHLDGQLQISTAYQNTGSAQTPVTFAVEVVLPAAVFLDEDPAVPERGNGWRYAGRRIAGNDFILMFDFVVDGDPSRPRPLQQQPTVSNAVSDSGQLRFRPRYKPTSRKPSFTLAATATPIAPLANGKPISTSRQFA